MEPAPTEMTNTELIDQLRRAASIWFKNTDLLLLEELIRRYRYANTQSTPVQRTNQDDSPR